MAVKSLSGGSKLQAALTDISKRVNKAAAVQVGFLEGATYPDGTSVAMVAAIQNFGAPAVGIPPRPYFSDMITKESPHWGSDLGKVLAANEFDAAKSLSLMGEEISGELREAIINTNSPALSEITLMLRKMRSEDQGLVVTGKTVGEAASRVAAGESSDGVSTKALIDTGHMLDSIDFHVKES